LALIYLLAMAHAYDFSDHRWQALLEASAARKEQLLKSQDKYKKVEDMYLLFAKKASAFNSWFENAEEDLTDPVRCNSVEEIMVRRLVDVGLVN
jgi:spectrin alpha